MIHLITNCRNIAALFLTLVVAASPPSLKSARAQEKSVLDSPRVFLNGPAQILELSATQEPALNETETAYSVLDVQVVQTEQQAAGQAETETPQPLRFESDQAIEEVVLHQDQANSEDPNLEVLMRAPLHEAFAEVYQHDAKPSPIVEREPPEFVDELPPEYKPDGDNVQWIPGYWAWDEDRDDFLWISGIWRDVPPGQRWIPGYWQSLDTGYRWVSGFWTSEESQELEYTPQPPVSIDNGPSYVAPSEDHYYVPGNWIYQNSHFAWQTGYWAPRRQNWIYVPARYIWTPHGCIYRPAYWDYEIARRGVVFAPVCFRSPVYGTVNYRYTPNCVVNINYDFLVHLFIRPTCNQYYFGDWYDSRYLSRNIYAWSNYCRSPRLRRAYDPLYAYYNCRSSRYNNVQLVSWVQNQHRFYQTNYDYRPRHTLNAQISFAQNSHYRQRNQDAVRRASYGESYKTHVDRERNKNALANHKYQHLDTRDRLRLAQATVPIRELSKQRQTLSRDQDAQHHTKLILGDRKKSDPNKQLQQVRRQAKDSNQVLEPRERDRNQVQRNAKRENEALTKSIKANQRINAKQLDLRRSREDDKNARTAPAPKSLAQTPQQHRNTPSQSVDEQKRQPRIAEPTRREKQPSQVQRKRTQVVPQPDRNQLQRIQSQERQRIDAQRESEKVANQKRQSQANVQNHRDAIRVAQQNQSPEQRSRRSQETQQRVTKLRTSPGDTAIQSQRQSTSRNQARDNPILLRQQLESQRQADQQRANQQAQQRARLDAQKRTQQDAQRRAQQAAQKRTQQEAQKLDQRNSLKQAQQQREAQQESQQRNLQNRAQQEAQKRAQQESLKRVQQQRESQQKSQRREAQNRAQQESQKRAQQNAQKRAQQEAQKQAQRDAQKRAQQQREAQQKSQQREAQKRAEQQRDAQQKAKQLESKRRAEQQRAHAQRESQQRAQRQAQQRAQQTAERQRQQAQRSKKNGK